MTLEIKKGIDIYLDVCGLEADDSPVYNKKWLSVESEIEWLKDFIDTHAFQLRQSQLIPLVYHLQQLEGEHK